MLLDSGYFLPPQLVAAGELVDGGLIVKYHHLYHGDKLITDKHSQALMFLERAVLKVDGEPHLVRPGELVLVPKGSVMVSCADNQPTALLSFASKR